VRLYPGGGRSYVLKVRVDGRYALVTLGGCHELTLEAARREAAHKLLEAKAGRLEVVEVPKLADFAPRFLDRYRTRGKGRRARDLRGWVRRVERMVDFEHEPGRKLGALRLDQVRAYHLQECIDTQSPGERSQYKSAARQLWEAARQWREVPGTAANPADGVVIARNVQGAGVKKRQLSQDEISRCFSDADRSSSRLLGPYLRILADTGSRPGELARARWDRVDWEAGTITIADSKTGDDARLVLSKQGTETLRHLNELSGHAEWLFPAAKGTGPMPYSTLRGAWYASRTDPTIALKHLRSTAASRVFFEAAMACAAERLNHRSRTVTERSYVDLTPEQQRELRHLESSTSN
jgi:integrase